MPRGVYIRTHEYRTKIGNATRGRKLSVETRKKMSIAQMGEKHYLFGKKIPKEQVEKMRVAHLGKKLSEETKRKIGLKNKGNKYCLGNIHNALTREKISSGKRGSKNPRWKGGVSTLNHQIRNSFKSKSWVLNVFTRDNYTCQKCGQVGRKLNAHHIKTFLSIMKENKISSIEEADQCKELWDINNGITLCYKCHKDIHSNKNV